MPSIRVHQSVEMTRDRFVVELVHRRAGTVGLELGVAGFVDARRRFALAIQGWEDNTWIRPFLTRLEGHFERSERDDLTRVVFVRRGLTQPLTFISLLIPYTVIRYLLGRWEDIEPPLTDYLLLAFSIVLVPAIGIVLYNIERRTHQLLERALLLIYGQPTLERD